MFRFFASLARYDEVDDRYDIDAVMGPDEFHDGYPGAPGTGLRNDAYTNVMTAWMLRRAVETVSLLEHRYCRPLWNRLRVLFHADGVISQFEGFQDLPEFDWESYRARYQSIAGLDLILNAEGDSTDNHRLSKQDVTFSINYREQPIRVRIEGREAVLVPGQTLDFPLERRTLPGS